MSYSKDDLMKIKILSDIFSLTENKVKMLLTKGYTFDKLEVLLEFQTYDELIKGE